MGVASACLENHRQRGVVFLAAAGTLITRASGRGEDDTSLSVVLEDADAIPS